MKMLTLLTLVVCITVSSSRAGPPRRCEYFFKNLDADVTIESGHSMFNIIYRIDIGRDQSMGEHRETYLTEPSEYFMLFENNVMVRNCLPAGLDVVLHVRIDREPSCEPGFLFISVTYTVPIFERSIADTVITVPCNGRDDVEVMTIAFENQGTCNHFECTLECLECFGKFFWIIDGSTVVTEHDDMLFGVTHYVYITCIDSGSSRLPPGGYASKEFHIRFQMSPSCLTTTSTQQAMESTPLTTISTRSISQSTIPMTTPDMTSATGSTMRAVSSTLSLKQTARSQPTTTAAPIYSSTIISNTSTTATTLMTTSKPKQPSPTEQFPTTKSTITTTTHVTTSTQNQATTTRQNLTPKSTTAITNMTTSKQNQATTKGPTSTAISTNATERLITSKPKQATTTGQNPTTKSLTTATTFVTTSKPIQALTTGQNPTSKSTSTTPIVTASMPNPALTTRRSPTTTSSSTTSVMSTSKPNQASTTGQIPTSESTSTATLWTTSNTNHASTTGHRPTSESTSTTTILTTSKPNQALTTEQNLTTTKLKEIASGKTTKQAQNTSREPTPTYLFSTFVISPSTEKVNVSAKLMVSTELNLSSVYWPTQTVNLTSYSPTISTPETIATHRHTLSTTNLSALSAMWTRSLPQSPFSTPSMKTTRKTIKHTKYKIRSTKSAILVSTFRNTSATSSTSITQSTPFKSTNEAPFFNKLANVVAVSSVLGILILFGLLSFSFVLWKKCCKANSVGSWSQSREKINHSDKNENVSIRIPRY